MDQPLLPGLSDKINLTRNKTHQATIMLLNPHGHDRKDVHNAYRTLASMYHPDRISDPVQQKKAAELMISINKLWNIYQSNPNFSHIQEVITSFQRSKSGPLHNKYSYRSK
jgi:curved DNA-binding protein CbpA